MSSMLLRRYFWKQLYFNLFLQKLESFTLLSFEINQFFKLLQLTHSIWKRVTINGSKSCMARKWSKVKNHITLSLLNVNTEQIPNVPPAIASANYDPSIIKRTSLFYSITEKITLLKIFSFEIWEPSMAFSRLDTIQVMMEISERCTSCYQRSRKFLTKQNQTNLLKRKKIWRKKRKKSICS